MELRWVRVATILLVAAGFALSGCEGDDGDDGDGVNEPPCWQRRWQRGANRR